MKSFYLYIIVSLLLIVIPKENAFTSNNHKMQITWPVLSTNGVWKTLPLSNVESQFSNEMPGGLAKFTDGEKIYILRYCTRVTRKLHPIADCFKSSGFKIKESQNILIKDGKYFSTFTANRDKESLSVMETFWDLNGNSWSDVSAWYWENYANANGPWYSCVIISNMIKK